LSAPSSRPAPAAPARSLASWLASAAPPPLRAPLRRPLGGLTPPVLCAEGVWSLRVFSSRATPSRWDTQNEHCPRVGAARGRPLSVKSSLPLDSIPLRFCLSWPSGRHYLFGGGWFWPRIASNGRPCGRSRGAPAPRAPLGWGPASPASLASSLTVGPCAWRRASGTAVAAYRRHFLSATCVQRARRHGSCWSLHAAWQE
jgi:hypothetical protein